MYIRTKLILFVILTATLFNSAINTKAADNNRFVVVIDAGHGGKDPGAVGGNFKEKDINLSVALKLGKMLQDSCPEIRVVYTRMTDVFVGLNERSSLSNRVRADLFISIHSNASKNSAARGIETYVMGMEKSSDNLRVAMLENSVVTQEESYGTKYEGYDPSSSESFIIFSLQQSTFQTESLNLASEIQHQYVSRLSSQVLDKGVKQANFLVLWRTASPSVLTEIGFISNAQDRLFITSEKGQSSIAYSLFSSVVSYYRHHQVRRTPVQTVKQDTVQNVTVRPVYRVQLFALKKALPVTPKYFFSWTDKVECKYENGFFKYLVGSSNVYEEILTLQDSLRKKFPDCFIVAFLNGESIGVGEARKIK